MTEYDRGRMDERARILGFLDALAAVSKAKGQGPAEGHLSSTCWLRHPQCALLAVRRFVGTVTVEMDSTPVRAQEE